MAPGRPHVVAVSKLNRILIKLLPEGWYSLQEQPVIVGAESMPEPDISIIRGSISDYLHHRPTVSDIELLVEVADSSLAIDSRVVLRTYAMAGIPVYWIVNLRDLRIDVYSGPEGRIYKEHHVYGPDDEIPVILGGREVCRIAVRKFCPEPKANKLDD